MTLLLAKTCKIIYMDSILGGFWVGFFSICWLVINSGLRLVINDGLL